MNQNKAYSILVHYICHITEMRKTILEEKIAPLLETSSSVQNISKKLGKNSLTIVDCQNIVSYLKSTALKSTDCNKRILYEMIKEFIESVTSDSDIVNALLKKHSDLVEKQIPDPIAYSQRPNVITNCSTNDRLGIKRAKVYSDVQKHETCGRDVIFLRGDEHCGKSAFLKWIINNPQINNRCFNARFMYSGTDFEISTILANILFCFTNENTGSSSLADMENKLKLCFRNHENILIIVDDIDDVDLESFNCFFSSFSRIKNNETFHVTFLLTCQHPVKDKIDILKKHNFDPTTIKMQSMVNETEWQDFVKQLTINEPNINDIIEEDKSLIPWIFEFSPTKELTVLQQVLYYFLKRKSAGATIASIKKVLSETEDRTLFDINETEKAFNSLSPDVQRILIAFSLVNFPTTISVIGKLTSIPRVYDDGAPEENSRLDIAFDEIERQMLLMKREKNNQYYCTISYRMKEYLRKRITSSVSFCTDIISSFAQHCIQETKKLDMCYYDLDLLKTLDSDNSPEDINIDVINELLNLCEQCELWEEFYQLSRNTRYYYFNRHRSGCGFKSIHYRRSCAGRKMHSPQNEFEALLYFCNVCSKTKEYEYVDTAFERLSKLCCDETISNDLKCKYYYVLGLYCFSKDELFEAKQHFEDCIQMMDDYYRLDVMKKDRNLYYDYLTAKRWESDCLCRLAEKGKVSANEVIETIKLLLDEVENESQKIRFTRAVVHAKLIRGRIYKLIPEMQRDLESVIEQLREYESIITNDGYYITQYESILAF